MCIQPVVIQQGFDQAEQVIGWTLHIVQIETLAFFGSDPLQQVGIAQDGTHGSFDIVGDGQH